MKNEEVAKAEIGKAESRNGTARRRDHWTMGLRDYGVRDEGTAGRRDYGHHGAEG